MPPRYGCAASRRLGHPRWHRARRLGSSRSTRLGGRMALSDIPGRFVAWNVHPSLLPFGGRPIEYPVVIGYLAWMTGWFGRDNVSFFIANGVVNVGLALVMTVLLLDVAVTASGVGRSACHSRCTRFTTGTWWRWCLRSPVSSRSIGTATGPAGRSWRSGHRRRSFPVLFLPRSRCCGGDAGDRRARCQLVGAFADHDAAAERPGRGAELVDVGLPGVVPGRTIRDVGEHLVLARCTQRSSCSRCWGTTSKESPTCCCDRHSLARWS